MKKLLIVLSLASSACRPPTPAEEVAILKLELKISRVKCFGYTINPKYPRDAEVSVACDKLVK